MRYTDAEREIAFKNIAKGLMNGTPLRDLIGAKGQVGKNTFYDWLDKYEKLRERYARAKEIAADALYDELLQIARTPILGKTVEVGPKGKTVTTADALGHRRLLADVIKWRLAKERPSKYGEKLDITTDGEQLGLAPIVGMIIKNEITPDDPDQTEESYNDDDLL